MPSEPSSTARDEMTPDEVLRSVVIAATQRIPGATQGQTNEAADRVAKWLAQSGCEVVRRAE